MNNGFSQSISKKGFTLLTWHSFQQQVTSHAYAKHWTADGQALLGCYCCPHVVLMKTRPEHHFSPSYFPRRQWIPLNTSIKCTLDQYIQDSDLSGNSSVLVSTSRVYGGEASPKFFSTACFFHSQGRQSIFLKQETLIPESLRLGRSSRGLCPSPCSEESGCSI